MPTDSLACPKCGYIYDPQLRFCTHCGTKLPAPAVTFDPSITAPSGLASGIEPDADHLTDEPYYDRGAGSKAGDEPATVPLPLPKYYGSDAQDESPEEKEPLPPPQASGLLIGTNIVVAFLVPPWGIILAIIWAFNRSYRSAVVPLFFAAIVGGGLWGWGFYIDTRNNIYIEPGKILNEYIEAQDWARDRTGHYHSLVDLKLRGFLPSDFPESSNLELTVVEHVLGPTGYLVELRPGSEESRIYGMQSLWTDQTGDMHKGSMDGSRFLPTSD